MWRRFIEISAFARFKFQCLIKENEDLKAGFFLTCNESTNFAKSGGGGRWI